MRKCDTCFKNEHLGKIMRKYDTCFENGNSFELTMN